VLEKHPQSDLEQALLRRMICARSGRAPRRGRTPMSRGIRGPAHDCDCLTFSIIWLTTLVCSRSGLNMMISASSSTFTLCPGGQ